MTPIRTAARTLLGALFVGSGWMALRHPDRLVPKAKPVTDRLSPALQAASLPTEAETLVKVNGAVQLAGGLLLATGHLTRPAAAALAVSVVPRRSRPTRSGPRPTRNAAPTSGSSSPRTWASSAACCTRRWIAAAGPAWSGAPGTRPATPAAARRRSARRRGCPVRSRRPRPAASRGAPVARWASRSAMPPGGPARPRRTRAGRSAARRGPHGARPGWRRAPSKSAAASRSDLFYDLGRCRLAGRRRPRFT